MAGTVPSVVPGTTSPQAEHELLAHQQKVVTNPIIGETLPWGGGAVPPLWMACKGQILKVADNRQLFRLLNKSCGGDGKTTFALPNAKHIPQIIAVAGTFPGSKEALATAYALRKP